MLIGSEPLLIECAAMLRQRGYLIAAVVTKRPTIIAWATDHGIAVLADADALRAMPSGGFDYLFSITNLSIVAPDILALAARAAINFHDGPLPDYAGLNTPVWALLNGEDRHGVTWHGMEADVDTGTVLVARSFAIDAGETAYSLNTKCFAAALETFAELLDVLPERATPTGLRAGEPQRYYGRDDRPPAAATIRFDRPAQDIVRLVRALDHGGHANMLGMAKIRAGERIILVGGAAIVSHKSACPPGTVIRIDADGIVVTTQTDAVLLTALSDTAGVPIDSADLLMRHGVGAGTRWEEETKHRRDTLSVLDRAVARHERWWRGRLATYDPLALPLSVSPSGSPGEAGSDVSVAGNASVGTVLAALVALLGRVADRATFDLGHTDPVFAARFAEVAPWFARQVPLRVMIDFERPLSELTDALANARRELHRRIGYSADLIARCPELRGSHADLPVAVVIVDRLDDALASAGAALTIAVTADGRKMRWLAAEGVDRAIVGTLQRGFATLLAGAAADPARPVGRLPLVELDDGVTADRSDILTDARCVHAMFVDQAHRTPGAPAVTSRGQTLTYAELDCRSNRLAVHLRQLGVGPGSFVGIHLDRSLEMPVALIAILKAGGAFVPLDPAYPRDRIAHMIHDSRMRFIVTQDDLAAALPACDATVVRLDTDRPLTAIQPDTKVEGGAGPADLAYVIYTSGSTGLPKGVMVEHRQLANFFAGMDAVVAPGGTWLAVTSLSFDISVLELCWTLTRGCHVVIAGGDAMTAVAAPPARPVQFSLFYFASADGGAAADQYRLLLDGARFADTHGFTAVWTPERHFHAFGGLYPNPSVTSAAIAAITTRVAIRGGSVVMPLHHPVRVAEEWSLVDNLSGGRVGIAFASGWQPNDFLLRPENFADKTAALMSGIDTVRALWRGETRAFPGPLGTPVEVAIFPRPVQRELPFWITSAGNPDTFAAAGRAGAFVLTHLLGQTTDELAAKLAHYRQAWRAAGHAGEGHVTLMLHSFVGDDAAAVRAAVRQPLIDYLRTSTNLVKEFAWSFPAFKRRPGMAQGDAPDLAQLDEEEMAALLDFAFERYFATGGLFGTPEHCLAMVERVRDAGVDEIGCLIDFGIPAPTVLDHLPALDTLRQLAAAQATPVDETLPGLMRRHRVTHLQCTPSLAQMLASDDAARPCLADLHQMLVGGEAFPPDLATDLHALVGGRVVNMYGPTETTIWSACHVLDGAAGRVPIGRALADQQTHILDSRGERVLPGLPGELVIGGAGVGRGYHDRAALTAERFVDHPVHGRVYRTGDLARRRTDGVTEFLRRIDHQVKIRGHRIELGEIEVVLGQHPAVARAIVIAREDTPGDARLVAYYIAASGSAASSADLADHLAAHLPDFMVPAHLIAVASFPQTPNGKIDRAAFPQPNAAVPIASPIAFVACGDGMEADIAAVWRDVLRVPAVGLRDNFFDLGGHSLLAVQVHRRLREALGRPIPLTDIFRFPTIEALARHLSDPGDDGAATRTGQGRAEQRRSALQRRGLRIPASVDA